MNIQAIGHGREVIGKPIAYRLYLLFGGLAIMSAIFLL